VPKIFYFFGFFPLTYTEVPVLKNGVNILVYFIVIFRIGPGSLRSIIPQLTGAQSGNGTPFGMVRLSMSGSPAGSRPHIQIGNQSTVGSRPERPHIVIDPTEGMPEEQRHGIQHMIQNILLFGKKLDF